MPILGTCVFVRVRLHTEAPNLPLVLFYYLRFLRFPQSETNRFSTIIFFFFFLNTPPRKKNNPFFKAPAPRGVYLIIW